MITFFEINFGSGRHELVADLRRHVQSAIVYWPYRCSLNSPNFGRSMLTLVFPKHLRPLIEKAVIASLNLTQNSAMLRDNSDFFQSS